MSLWNLAKESAGMRQYQGNTPRILLVGGSGQLGKEILNLIMDKHQFWAPSKSTIDVTMPYDKIRGEVTSYRPDVIINCAAMHDLEKCEAFPEIAYNINAIGQLKLSWAAQVVGATMIYISTNCVFDGNSDRCYIETDWPNPISVYGASKLSGEKFSFTACEKTYAIRTSGIFGKFPPSGKPNGNFVDVVVRNLQEGKEFRAKTFEYINPTYAPALALNLVEVFADKANTKKHPKYGIYHIVGSTTVNWYEYAVAIAASANLDYTKIKPVCKYEGSTPNIRPRMGALRSLTVGNKNWYLSTCLGMYMKEKYGIGA